MSSCSHTVCGREHRIWVPMDTSRYASIQRHPYCTLCGVVKNISDDQSKGIGYWMNKLALISSQLDLTQCQKRRIAKDLERHEYLHDTFGAFGSGQQEVFLKIVSKHCDISMIDLDILFTPVHHERVR